MKTQEIFDLYDLMLEQLRDLYNGEKQQLTFLLKADELAGSIELDDMIRMHRRETKRQLDRLDEVFNILDEEPSGEYCDGISGLVDEALKLADRCQNSEVRDAGLITSIQHINHYEMAGYGTAIAYAKALNQHEVAEILLKTLWEEKDADWGLSNLAEEQVNVDARWSTITNKAKQKIEATGA